MKIKYLYMYSAKNIKTYFSSFSASWGCHSYFELHVKVLHIYFSECFLLEAHCPQSNKLRFVCESGWENCQNE